MLFSIIKELILKVIFFWRRIKFYSLSKNYAEELHSLARNGVFVRSNFLDKEKCVYLRKKIDDYILNEDVSVWCDDLESDHRIYFVDTIDEEFNKIYEDKYFRDILKCYLGTADPKGMLLAARIDYKDNNLGSGGGWHRDSPYSNQFKAICYLSDVEDNSGPFQLIKGSHRTRVILASLFKGIFLPGQYRYNDNEVDNYCSYHKDEPFSVVGNQGSLVFADTKAIHRGKPLEKGSRYVLFCYFWHSEIPRHFEVLRQKKGE